MIEYGIEFGPCVGAQHGDAGVAEVGDTFEERRRGEVAAYVQDSPVFVDIVDAFGNLSAQKPELGRVVERLGREAIQGARHVMEYPWCSY